MELLELVKQIEVKINDRIDEFSKIGAQVKDLTKQIEDNHKKMYKIVVELEPVEYLVWQQNPKLCELFEALKDQHKAKETTLEKLVSK